MWIALISFSLVPLACSAMMIHLIRDGRNRDDDAGAAGSGEEKDGKPASVTEVACWAHVRRKFFDEYQRSSVSGAPAPLLAPLDVAYAAILISGAMAGLA